MNSLQNFLDYFMKNHYCLKTPEKRVAQSIAQYFDGVEYDRIDWITHKIEKCGFQFLESSSGCFYSCYKKIQFPFCQKKSLAFHEIGHAMDFISIEKVSKIVRGRRFTKQEERWYSRDIVLSTGKTLHQIVKDEVKLRGEALHETLLAIHKESVLNALDEEIVKEFLLGVELLNARDKARRQYRYSKDKNCAEAQELNREYLRLQEEIERHGCFNKVNKLVYGSDAYKSFCNAYGLLSDMIVGYVGDRRLLPGHSRSYMNDKGFGAEFFAEAFMLDTLKWEDVLRTVERYLPQSYEAYRELARMVEGENCKIA